MALKIILSTENGTGNLWFFSLVVPIKCSFLFPLLDTTWSDFDFSWKFADLPQFEGESAVCSTALIVNRYSLRQRCL